MTRWLWLVSVLLVGPASAAEGTPEIAAGRSVEDVISEYCLNISDKAAEERAARQAETLKTLEVRLDDKIKQLEERRSELQGWVEKQEKLRSGAEKELVDIYATMDPEVAARQMENIDAKLASSILRQLKPRQASAILNEMKAEKAATLVKMLATVTVAGPVKK